MRVPNIRAKFKYLLKDLHRYKITGERLQEILRGYGFWADAHDLNLILSTRIKPRALTRMGKAALKRGGYLPLFNVWWAYKTKKQSIHQVEFIKVKYWTEVEVIEKRTDFRQRYNINGDPYSFKNAIFIRSETIEKRIENERYA